MFASPPRLVLMLAVVTTIHCGARSALRDPPPAAPDALEAPDAVLDVSRDGPDALDADQDAGPFCGCPGTPAYTHCVLPRMCCPVTRTCEDPAHFSCTGSTPPPCH